MAVSKVVLGNETLVDLTSDTVSENTLLEGATAHAANGEQITGGVVVTPMYTGTKSAIESAIASGEIPDGAVVNITDDEETSSFQTQINEINSSLNNLNFSWKKVNNIASIPTTANEILLRGLIIGSQYGTCVIPYESLTDTETIYNYGGYYYNSSSNGYFQTKISKTNISSLRINNGSEVSVSVEIYYR